MGVQVTYLCVVSTTLEHLSDPRIPKRALPAEPPCVEFGERVAKSLPAVAIEGCRGLVTKRD